jgi:transposase InsO family protein
MSTEDTDKPISSQIERLNEKNYRSWQTQVRAVLRHQKVLDVVDGTTPKPILEPAGTLPTKDETDAHRKLIDAWETKAARACATLLPTISGRLMTYVEDEDDPARIWTILRDRFRPTTDVTLAQSLKHIVTLRMADDGDMEAHIRDFTACKRRVEEHGVVFKDIVYRTFFLISMPTTYQMTVTAIESQDGVTLEVAQNRFLEEWRKRKGQPKGGLLMTALHTSKGSHKGRRKPGNSNGNPNSNINSKLLLCTHCQKRGHVESTCWAKHPHLKDNSRPAPAGEARVAFHTTTKTARKAHIGGNGDTGNPNHWILDSGASEHFSPHKHILTDYKKLDEPVEVNTAKGKLLGIGTGSVHLVVEGQSGDVIPITLHEVLHVPGMDSNLLSSNVLLGKGLEVSMHPTRGINILLGDHIVAKTVPHGKLWRLKTVDGELYALKTVGPKPKEPQPPKPLSYNIWHRRFAHLGPWNLQLVQKLVEGMAIDPETLPKEGYACEACILGSQTRNLSDAPMTRCTVPGDRIHSDICGWITPIALGESRYILIFIDDATRMTYLFVIKTKTAKEVRECFLKFRNIFEQDGRRIKSIRTDGGGEYRKQMAELCTETGIHHEETAPYTPEQNGVAERANRTICERIRAILAETKLPKELWAEIACAVAHLKNRSPTSALNGMTPYEALYGRRPDVSHLIAIGTKAFVHTPKKKTKKLDSRSLEGIMVGYGGSNQYRIWIPGTNKIKVRVSRDVRFVGEDTHGPVGAHGNVAPHGDAGGHGNAGAQPNEPIIYDMIEVLPEPRAEPESESEESGSESESESESGSEGESGKEIGDGNESDIYGDDDETIPRDATVEPESFVSAPSSPQPEPPTSTRPSRNRKAPVRLDPGTYISAQHEASHVYKADTTMWSESAGYVEPQSYEEAVNDPLYGKEWRAAVQEEYDSLMKNGAWELDNLPPGKNLVTCKWVFKAKHDANGNITRFKARLVARGFSQAYGVDYFDTFAPVAKLTTYRTIFALAALEKWEIHGMDVITAYLLGKLDEEIYMMQPEGFIRMGMKRNMVCRLLRSLYGLKQAARVWNLKIHAFLIKIGFVRSSADPCLYIDVKRCLYITIWVDDLLIVGKHGSDIANVKAQLSREFEMKDLGELEHFLGMRISRVNGGITIDQNGYIRQILERFGMEASKAVSTPFATGSRLVNANHDGKGAATPSTTDIKEYQAMVGSLMYAMLCTRPDLAYTIQQLSQFNSNPTNAHFQAAKRGFRYLQGSQTTGPTYNGDITGPIQGYCDADFAMNGDRKSISGILFLLAGAPISWQAKKQTTVAQSTVESEYAAMAHAAKELIWLQQLLKDLGMSKYAPTTLYCDNQGAISLAKNPTHHAKTKHVDVQLHFIRDHVEKGTIKVEYCPTEDMLADLMTKGLARERHARLMGLMGTREVTKTTTASSSEIGGDDLKGHGDVATSGSVELRGSHAVQHSDMDAR